MAMVTLTTNTTTKVLLFFVLLLFSISKIAVGYHVLLIGDSVDRNIVQDWCYIDVYRPIHRDGNYFSCPACTVWYENLGRKAEFQICIKGNDSIANIFVFGSKDEGPYFMNYGVEKRGFTKNVLPQAITAYFMKYGAPDLIVFQIGMWDIAYILEKLKGLYPHQDGKLLLQEKTSVWNQTMETYTANMRKRIQQIQDTVAKNIEVLNISTPVNMALRTVVFNKLYGVLIPDVNHALRRLAKEYGFSLFDYDNELWSIYNWNYDKYADLVFCDQNHPVMEYSALAGEKLLGRRYTSNMIMRGKATPRPKVCISPHMQVAHHFKCSIDVMREQYPNNKYTRVALIAPQQDPMGITHNNSTLYYLHLKDGLPYRYGPISEDVRMKMGLSPNEIVHLPIEDINNIPLISSFPFASIFERNVTFFNLTDGRMYMYMNQSNTYRMIYPSSESDARVNKVDIIQQADLDLIRVIFKGKPELYHERALIRFDKTIYVILNGMKHKIPSLSVFRRFGHDEIEVQVLSKKDFDIIPTGNPL